MKAYKRFLAMGLASLAVALGLAVWSTSAVSAQDPKGDVCTGVNTVASGGSGGSCSGGGPEISKVVAAVANILSLIAGVAGVLMIVVAGLRYITGGGDPSSVAAAKNSIIYAIVGLIVVALAQILVRFVLNKAGSGGGN